MPIDNPFKENLGLIESSAAATEDDFEKLKTATIEATELRRSYTKLQKELMDISRETEALGKNNRDLKIDLMKLLIQKEELSLELTSIRENLDDKVRECENFENNEVSQCLSGEEVDQLETKYSLASQKLLVTKIREAKSKLMKYGFPANYFE